MQDSTQRAASRHGRRAFTFARAFLHCTQALRVTDSGTLRCFEEAFPWARRGSDPVVDSDVFGVVVGVLLSPNEGRILRNELFMLDMVNRL